jgi:hypothetical protein
MEEVYGRYSGWERAAENYEQWLGAWQESDETVLGIVCAAVEWVEANIVGACPFS